MSRVFACSDLHGQWDLWQQIKEFLHPDDVLYFLGDAIDRGEKGYEIMKELMSDSRVIYLKGNHEQMMEDALQEYQENGGQWYGEEYDLWAWNGCYPTIEEWEADGRRCEWIHILKKLPRCKVYINKEEREVYLSHAGFTPGTRVITDYDLVWDRKHIYDEIDDSIPESGCVIVHGHTPIQHLVQELGSAEYVEADGVVLYGNSTKIDIDCGSFATHKISLLDLDTFERVVFNER